MCTRKDDGLIDCVRTITEMTFLSIPRIVYRSGNAAADHRRRSRAGEAGSHVAFAVLELVELF